MYSKNPLNHNLFSSQERFRAQLVWAFLMSIELFWANNMAKYYCEILQIVATLEGLNNKWPTASIRYWIRPIVQKSYISKKYALLEVNNFSSVNLLLKSTCTDHLWNPFLVVMCNSLWKYINIVKITKKGVFTCSILASIEQENTPLTLFKIA